jgi:MFS superfamily sulfate permease-like transporter
MVDIINTILQGVQIATLIALIIYVKKTWDMAVSTEKSAKVSERTLDEIKKTRDQEIAPYVVVYFDFKDHEMYLIVENIGKGLARDFKVEFKPKLQNTRGNEINNISMIRDGIASIPPKYKIKTFFDMSFSYFDNELPLNIKLR